MRERGHHPKPSTSPLEGEVGSPRSGEPDGGEAKPPTTYTPRAQTSARELRQNMTEAERRLWSALRGGRLQGLKVRRQQPIGNYIADFFCPSARLIVELDGSQHSEEGTLWHDYHRTKWLESKGYRVIRFTNCAALKHTSDVVEGIWATINPPVHRKFEKPASPSPLEGEGVSPRSGETDGGQSAAVDRPPSVAPSARRLPPQGGKCSSNGEDGTP